MPAINYPSVSFPLLPILFFFFCGRVVGFFFGGWGEGGVLDPAPILPQEGSEVKFRKKEENDG